LSCDVASAKTIERKNLLRIENRHDILSFGRFDWKKSPTRQIRRMKTMYWKKRNAKMKMTTTRRTTTNNPKKSKIVRLPPFRREKDSF
jgi:hypothetical protein